ncbi:unnamed protein product [Brassica rapa subsp. narinosa]
MNGSWNYALVCGWNDVVKANGLKDGDNISLWSFRNRPWGMRMIPYLKQSTSP